MSATNNVLRVSASKLDNEFAGNSQHKKYEAQLKAIDKNGDGVIDIDELCQKIEEMATVEKQLRLLKWAAIITGVFALLTIAAVVGLVYAVVVLTKDTQVSSSGIMTTKDSAATPIATGQVINLDSLSNLYTKSLGDLAYVSYITIPSDNGGRVVQVAQIDLIDNTSATVTTSSGNKYIIDASGISEQTSNQTAMRRLLGANRNNTGVVGSIHPGVLKPGRFRSTDCDTCKSACISSCNTQYPNADPFGGNWGAYMNCLYGCSSTICATQCATPTPIPAPTPTPTDPCTAKCNSCVQQYPDVGPMNSKWSAFTACLGSCPCWAAG